MTCWNSGALCPGLHLHASYPCLHRRVSVCILRCSILAKNVDFWRWKMETWAGREGFSRHLRDDGTANRQNVSLRPDKRGPRRPRRSLGAGADCHKSTFLAKNGGRRLKRTARGGKKRGGTGARSPVGAEATCMWRRAAMRIERAVSGQSFT